MSGTIAGVQCCPRCGSWERAFGDDPDDRRDALRNWVITQHDRHGLGWSAIADLLNRYDFWPLGYGKQWHPSGIQSLYERPTRRSA